ncbi:hypothetical protein BGX21_007511 [Mortierella sp. AD011]|nr:hypothetical protein BGX20_003156 [Mortierella sp. AD010]KAF9398639.1 hypothetical protein BGX21_007511 [Mortierella sp. AD011]
MGQRPQRRQERQNFFPSFSDSFFDPFTSEDPHSDSYYGIPNTYKQAPHRQQYQPRRAEQHQPVDEYQDDDEVEQTQYHPEHRTQYRQRPQQKQQQQRSNQQPQSHTASRRRSRRHRKRETQAPQDLQDHQAPVSHIHPQAPNAQANEMESLVPAAFGDEEESARINSEPKNGVRESRESRPYEEDSLEQDEQEEEESEESEGEQTFPDRELQQKSSAELKQIESDLEGLSNELDQILSGEITKKKQILFTEENLTKAMLKIDAVESGGDPSIRQKRKDLINQAEGLLEKVDEFKRLTNTSATN